MTSQAPDNATVTTESVVKAAEKAAGGTEAGQYKDEVTGEMISKR